MKFGSLFCGIGGFDLGLERAGMQCAWQVEIDPYAQKVLAKHWPDVRRHADVCTFPPEEGNWEVDVICGGFPCQDISYAGKGAGLAGARSGLWYEFARIIGDLRPRYVIVENVSALLTRGMGEVLGTLASLGYDAEWHVIPASAVGAPHRRDRVWIVAYADGRQVRGFNADTRDGGAVPQQGAERIVCEIGGGDDVADADGGGVRLRRRSSTAAAAGGREGEGDQRQRLRADAGPGGEGGDVADARREHGDGGPGVEGAPCRQAKERSEEVHHAERCREVGDVSHAVSDGPQGIVEAWATPGPADGSGGGWWATEPDVGRVAHGVPSRVDRLRCLGNAVVPQVVELIGRAIMDREAQTAEREE
jgi:DNA (cytosine-5)-methyltransferase 1